MYFQICNILRDDRTICKLSLLKSNISKIVHREEKTIYLKNKKGSFLLSTKRNNNKKRKKKHCTIYMNKKEIIQYSELK